MVYSAAPYDAAEHRSGSLRGPFACNQRLELWISCEWLKGPELFKPFGLAFPIAFDQEAYILECISTFSGKRPCASRMKTGPVDVCAGPFKMRRQFEAIARVQITDIFGRKPAAERYVPVQFNQAHRFADRQ